MGRSGGGRSSGGRSGGSFGGGRSSGGFSGGGRSSGRSSGGSFSHSGGYSHRHHGHGPHIHIGGYGYGYRHGGGIYSVIASFIIIIFIFIVMSSTSSNNSGYKVEKSTKEREALNGVVNKTEWYDDQIGWVSSKSVLISGIEDFYKKTGIQPYILLIPYSGEYWNNSVLNATAADDYLQKVYDDKFTDEAHFIFAYFACKNDIRSEMDGEFRYLSGYSADTIMDDEAIRILWGYFEKNYYDTSLSMEEMISNTFSETAESIMSSPTNFWDFANTTSIVVVIIVVVVVLYLIIKSKHKREKEKEKYTEEILSKPLETFGNDTSDLENKYK